MNTDCQNIYFMLKIIEDGLNFFVFLNHSTIYLYSVILR